MKKIKLLSMMTMLILAGSGLRAQLSVILTPEIGIHSSRSNPTGDLDISESFQGMSVNYSGIFSYRGGIGVGLQFQDNWGLLTGVAFNRKGGRVTVETRDPNNPFGVQLEDGTVTTDVGEVTATTTHNWLSVPILARAQFGKAFKVGLAVGPQFNFGLGKYTETVEYNLENTNINTDEDNYDFGDSTRDMLKRNHISLVILPYVSYDLNPKSSLRLSMMIERGSDMVNENFVVERPTGQRNVRGTLPNNQFGVMLSYEYRFDLNAGVKY